MPARRPSRQRTNPKSLALDDVASTARYVGSPYHKDRPGLAGMPKGRIAAGSKCPSHLADDLETAQSWLMAAIRAGNTGRWDEDRRFPLEVFHVVGETTFQAKLGSPGSGEYHGFPLEPFQSVRGLRDA